MEQAKMTVTVRRYQPITIFLIWVLLINGMGSILTHHHLSGSASHFVPYATSFDMVVIVPTLYYFLVVRRGIQTVASLFWIILVCLVRAHFVVPTVIHGEFLLAGAELGIVVLVFLRVRHAIRAGKDSSEPGEPMQYLHAACKAVVPVGPVAHFMASELTVLYYAIFSWRSRADRPNARVFTTHIKGGFAVLLTVLACLVLIEAPILHLIFSRWNKTIAWIFTALGIYGFLWIIGLSRSLALRPIIVSENGLQMSKGFLWHLRASWSEIHAIKSVGPNFSVSDPEFLDLSVGADANFVVTLSRHEIAQGPFGVTKRVKAIGLSVDDAQSFQKMLTLREHARNPDTSE